MWLILEQAYTSGLEPTFFFPSQISVLPTPNLDSIPLLLKESALIPPDTPPNQIEFLNEDKEVIPQDTPIKKVMEWVGYENPLIVRVLSEQVEETKEEEEIEKIEEEFEEERP